MTYITPRASALAMAHAASRVPYALSSPDAAASTKPLFVAEKSHARPFGCSPQLWVRQQWVYRVNPPNCASMRVWYMRGVILPSEVGSLMLAVSRGQLPFGLRGAGWAGCAGPLYPAVTMPPTAARAFSASRF